MPRFLPCTCTFLLFLNLAAARPARSAGIDPGLDVRGTVIDTSGAIVAGASVTLTDTSSGFERQTVTDGAGGFVFSAVPPGRYVVVALTPGFSPAAADVDPVRKVALKLRLEPAPLNELVTVPSELPDPRVVSTGTKIAASPMDIPQSIDAVPQTLLREQAARSMQDALRNVAAVTPNLGEGRRDQFLIRGFSAQSDTLVDGIRDDALYYRDLATVERVEVLKGPAAALFGRGSSGGVINHVLKKPRFDEPVADLSMMLGAFGTKRLSFDLGHSTVGRRTAARLTGGGRTRGPSAISHTYPASASHPRSPHSCRRPLP